MIAAVVQNNQFQQKIDMKGECDLMQPKKRQWTVMVYMVGAGNLDNNGFADLKEMKKVGSTSEVAIVAQFNRCVKYRPTKRYYLRRNNSDGALAADVVENLGETNPADPDVLEAFLQWGCANFPARRYLVVLWGHGNGADDEKLPDSAVSVLPSDDNAINPAPAGSDARLAFYQKRPPITQGIDLSPTATSLNEYTVDFLDNRRFKQVFESVSHELGRKIDVLGMDACLMSGAEVCYQLRESVRYTVAPEGFGPLDGWPYDSILGELVKYPQFTPEKLACLITEKYLASYADYEDVAITHSVCDVGKSAILAAAVDELATALMNSLSRGESRKAVMFARWQAQSFNGTDYVDLYDFCNLLRRGNNQPDVKAACRRVMRVISTEGFIRQSVYRGEEVQYTYGVSIYFPQVEVSRFYQKLDFAHDTHWPQFLARYIKKIQRPARKTG